MRTFREPSTPKLRSMRRAAVQLALAVSLILALPGASAAADHDNVCEPDRDCVRACTQKAWAMMRECIGDGYPFDKCGRKAIFLKRACVISECEPRPGCEERCEIHGQRLLHRCLEDGVELERCRAEARMATEACIEAECRDCACPAVYDPVCGIDGMTYGNACEAGCAGVQILHEGPCEPKCRPIACLPICPLGHNIGPDGCPRCECTPPPGCESDDDCGDDQVCRQICSLRPCRIDQPDCAPCFGVCLNRPEPPCVCPEIYDPVCGADGKTYSNGCFADCEDVEIAHEGRCSDQCRTNADCDNRRVCYPPTKTCQPECAIECFRYDPVCGEDGVTYGCGEPDAHCHGIEVIHRGECRLECGSEGSFCTPVPVPY